MTVGQELETNIRLEVISQAYNHRYGIALL
jgi:hypothetical protein